jgi:hypothetical protein
MPITWIGLLFCILSLSVQFWKLANKSLSGVMAEQALRDPQDAINNYRQRTVQCLVLGNYTEPRAYTVETLLLYYISDHFRTSDTQFGSWMVFGLIVRAAMRLGYHRDASHFVSVEGKALFLFLPETLAGLTKHLLMLLSPSLKFPCSKGRCNGASGT